MILDRKDKQIGKEMEKYKFKAMEGFMKTAFKMELVSNNEFADYWSTRQSMSTQWVFFKN